MNKDSSNRPNSWLSSQKDLISVFHAQASASEVCNTLQHAATRCNDFSSQVCQKRAMYMNKDFSKTPQLTVAQTRASSGEVCTTPQHTATHCNTLQRTASHCNYISWKKTPQTELHTRASSGEVCTTLQHTATHYNRFS